MLSIANQPFWDLNKSIFGLETSQLNCINWIQDSEILDYVRRL